MVLCTVEVRAAVTASLAPSRTSGVAPLSVFFDASGTVSDITTRPFHDLNYAWDFGDSSAGVWSLNGRPKNLAKGAVAGHVFETPGTYTVTLTVRNELGETDVEQVAITVQNPETVYAGANTVCFSTSGDFTGCPAGAGTVTTANISALQSRVATNRRLLLRRGETFVRDASVRINVAGPGTLGAFGAGARPIVLADGVAGGHTFVFANTPSQFSDWRVMDLDIRYQNWSGDCRIFNVEGTARDLLILRVATDGGSNAFNMNLSLAEYWQAQGSSFDVIDGLTIQDSSLRETATYLLYLSAHRFVFQGNSAVRTAADNSTMRFAWLDRAVLSDNEFGPRGGPNGHVLYVHAPAFSPRDVDGDGDIDTLTTNGQYTNRLLISGNVVHPGDEVAWTAHIAPQNGSSDERFRDIILERNLFLPGANVQYALHLAGPHQGVTVRENLFRGTNSSAVRIDPAGSQNASPADVLLSHNTCVGDNAPRLVRFETGASGVRARNNLVVGPNAALMSGTGVFAPGESGNLIRTAAQALLTSANPMVWSDFMPQTGSPAIGAADPTFAGMWDYTAAQRTDGAPDVGALERGAGGPPDTMPPAAPRALSVQ